MLSKWGRCPRFLASEDEQETSPGYLNGGLPPPYPRLRRGSTFEPAFSPLVPRSVRSGSKAPPRLCCVHSTPKAPPRPEHSSLFLPHSLLFTGQLLICAFFSAALRSFYVCRENISCLTICVTLPYTLCLVCLNMMLTLPCTYGQPCLVRMANSALYTRPTLPYP